MCTTNSGCCYPPTRLSVEVGYTCLGDLYIFLRTTLTEIARLSIRTFTRLSTTVLFAESRKDPLNRLLIESVLGYCHCHSLSIHHEIVNQYAVH